MYLDMADALISDVHETLGRHRHGEHSRLGRASDNSPLLGGLRIGKEAEEDEEDGDGQYFHYLTKWMFGMHLTLCGHKVTIICFVFSHSLSGCICSIWLFVIWYYDSVHITI